MGLQTQRFFKQSINQSTECKTVPLLTLQGLSPLLTATEIKETNKGQIKD